MKVIYTKDPHSAGFWLRPNHPNFRGLDIVAPNHNRDATFRSTAFVIPDFGSHDFMVEVFKTEHEKEFTERIMEGFVPFNRVKFNYELSKISLAKQFVFEECISEIDWVKRDFANNAEFRKLCLEKLKNAEEWPENNPSAMFRKKNLKAPQPGHELVEDRHLDSFQEGTVVWTLSMEFSTNVFVGYGERSHRSIYLNPTKDKDGNELLEKISPPPGSLVGIAAGNGLHGVQPTTQKIIDAIGDIREVFLATTNFHEFALSIARELVPNYSQKPKGIGY